MDTRGLHSIDPESNRMVSGAEYEAGPMPIREGWPEPVKAERLKGSASGFKPLTDPRSDVGPSPSWLRSQPDVLTSRPNSSFEDEGFLKTMSHRPARWPSGAASL